MARPLKYPQLAQLKNPGDAVMLPADGDACAKARGYAKRHQFRVETARVPGGILVRRLERRNGDGRRCLIWTSNDHRPHA